MTIADALQYAADRIDAAARLMTAIRDQVAAQLAAGTASVQTIINNFNARPLFALIYVDPVNGNNANDGSSFALAKRSCDAVLENIGSQGISILLFGDDTISRRHNAFTNVAIRGVQLASNSEGFIDAPRTLSYLGTAINSPSPIGTFSAGIFFSAGQFFLTGIIQKLPTVPSNLNFRPHIASSAFLDAQLLNSSIVADSAQASALFGSFNGGRTTATLTNTTLGANAPGHVFDGVAAGADPNTLWVYSTNLKAA